MGVVLCYIVFENRCYAYYLVEGLCPEDNNLPRAHESEISKIL